MSIKKEELIFNVIKISNYMNIKQPTNKLIFSWNNKWRNVIIYFILSPLHKPYNYYYYYIF
jgi:hypothetical protein